MSGGYYNKQEPTHGGYQDVLKIHNHGSQRIEETSNWYKKTTGSLMKTVGSLVTTVGSLRVLKYPGKGGVGCSFILILYRTGTYGSLVL